MSDDFPYPGLRPFERDETDIFFGREEHTDQLLERLDHVHFLAVVGPSGCGKSSLVRTGLLAGLETGFLISAGARWRVAQMRPGHQPFAYLTDALLADEAIAAEYVSHIASYSTEPAEAMAFLSHRALLQAELRRGPFSMHEILANVPLPEHTKLLILVDQFEEIFRYYQQGKEDEAAAFVSLLLATSQHPDVYIVITMRSDFIGDCALFHGLPEAINQGLFLTPRLNREQLRAAIEEPAGVFGGKIEPALVNRLLNDTGNNPDQLPVLQHALMRMWTIASAPPASPGGGHGAGGITLTMDHYVRIGALDKALSQHADEAYNELDPAQQRIAEIMFRNLSERGSQRRDTRRPVALGEVAALAQVPWPQVAAVVEVFRQEGRSFLTPPVGRELAPDSVLDISHESLIRQWQRLQDWTTQEAEAAELYQRLESSACRWKMGQAALWRTPELESALLWRDSAIPTAAWASRYGQHFDLAMRFLDASAAEQQAAQQQAEMARQRELRRARKRALGATVGFVCAVGVALLVFFFQQRAETAKQAAQKSFQQAQGVVDNFLSQFSDEKVQDVSGVQPVRQEVVGIALKYYQELLRQRGNDASVQAQMGRAYFLIGKSTGAMGANAEALKAYEAAAAIQQKLLEENPEHPDALRDLGLTYYSIGEMHLFAPRLEEALTSLEKARTLQEKLVHSYPDGEQYQHDLGNTFNRLGTTYYSLKLAEKAEFWLNKGVNIHQKLIDINPEEAKYKVALARHYNNLASLYNEGGEKSKVSFLQKGADSIEGPLQTHPNVRSYLDLASIVYRNLGSAQTDHAEYESARASLQKSIDIAARLVQENPTILKYRERQAWVYDYIVPRVNILQYQDVLGKAVVAYRELLRMQPAHASAWNNLGLALQKQDKQDEAIAAFREQVRVTPAHGYAWNNLGEALQAQGQLDEAIAAFREQVRVTPAHTWAWTNLGSALQAQGKFDEAVAAHRKQIEVSPEHTGAWNNLGNTLTSQGKLDEAIAAYKKQLEIEPDSAYAWNGLGLVLKEQGKRDEAIAAFREQVRVTPAHGYAWNNLGRAFDAQGQLDEAIAAFREQVRVTPAHTWAWTNLGLALQKQGQLDEAIAAFREQVRVTPAHTWAWTNLGEALRAQGKFDEAVAAHRKQIEVSPEHTGAWNNLGIALKSQGKLDEAIAAYKKQLEIEPDSEHAWNGLGVALDAQGKTDEAMAAFRKQLEIKPNYAWTWYNMGFTFLNQGKRDEAVAAFQKQVDVTPAHENAWNMLGSALWEQGRTEDALAAFQTQVQIKPNHQWAWHNMGVILNRQGKRDEAIAAFQKQVEVKSDHVEAWNSLGIALFKQEKNEAAASAFAKGLRIQPTNLHLLGNDIELALAQGDRDRLVRRIAIAMPQVTPKDQLYAILPFFSWLANPVQGWGHVLRVINELDPEVKFSWDFSDTARAITRLNLNATTQQIARHFIDFFEYRIDLPTLKARLEAS
jgi:tetratricopeptide (TPR) repeat protein